MKMTSFSWWVTQHQLQVLNISFGFTKERKLQSFSCCHSPSEECSVWFSLVKMCPRWMESDPLKHWVTWSGSHSAEGLILYLGAFCSGRTGGSSKDAPSCSVIRLISLLKCLLSRGLFGSFIPLHKDRFLQAQHYQHRHFGLSQGQAFSCGFIFVFLKPRSFWKRSCEFSSWERFLQRVLEPEMILL